ncbi:MAG: 2-thiouracil desulfurase family protein [Thermofilaceae archaeon]
MRYSKPKLVLSACLGVRAVRYDRKMIMDEHVEKLKRFVDFIPVCPEVEIGLSVPRNSLMLYREDSAYRYDEWY